MPVKIIDTHCHINFFPNAGDIALECEKRQVHTIYVTTLPSQFDETYEYVKGLKYIYPALGFHCLETDFNYKNEKNLFLKNIDKTRFIGEVGLDFSQNAISKKKDQIKLLKFILSTIQSQDKILTVHSRNAEDDVLKNLVEYDIKKAIFHWYSGKISTLKRIMDLGYYISINEAMCKSKKGQNIISKLRKDSVLIETDGPFVKNVFPYKNEKIYMYLSKIWNTPLNNVKEIIIRNFETLLDTKVRKNLFE